MNNLPADKYPRMIDQYSKAISASGAYPSEKNLLYYTDFLFKGIDLRNCKFLDIGGGSGVFSFFAAVSGAAETVNLEPEAAGSQSSMKEGFRALKGQLKECGSVRLVDQTFQDFDEDGFDTVLLHNSINHLDEEACIHLRESDTAVEKYRQLLSKLRRMCNAKGTIVVCDCSSRNFFHDVGLKNPIASTIEWHKHQTPETWRELLEEVGFRHLDTRWTSFNSLRAVGRLLIGWRLPAYFLTSHFCLRMKAC